MDAADWDERYRGSGPQDASVLFTAADLAGDLEGLGLTVDAGAEVLRPPLHL